MYLRGARKVRTIRSEWKELVVGCFAVLFVLAWAIYLFIVFVL
jgi:hypothetical protein